MCVAQENKNTLHAQQIGSGDHRLVFLHGLFGRGKNFTTIARGLDGEITSLMVDLPNHGVSEWTDHFDYMEMADAVAELLEQGFAKDGPVDVLGHSMGGKVAMILALKHPHLVRRLVVEDIAPIPAPEGRSEFDHLLGSLLTIDQASLRSRLQADEQLQDRIRSKGVRGFLLQNLRRARDGSFAWEPNLRLLYDSLDVIMDWPASQVEGLHFDGKVLWLAGELSRYVQDQDLPVMRSYFPRTVRVRVKGASHWVHSDKPQDVISALRTFLLAA